MCGIAGIINKTKRKPFDYRSFCVLGISNDSRGGDSCGVFIDGNVEYGVLEKKLFSNFFESSEILNNTKRSNIALLHCRKASVGSISKETAQPVVITDNVGETKFVMLHNGTIHNYEDLAKKYIPDIDIKGMTDSQVMARIFYYKGYDALSEYNGGSVFFIVDYRQPEPKILMFKGESKKSEYSTEVSEERPFYFIMDNEDEFVFSSIEIYLKALRPKGTVYTIVPNSLIQFTGDNIVIVKKYDRSSQTQTKKFVSTTATYYGGAAKSPSYGGYYGNGSSSSYNSSYLTADEVTNTYNISGKKAEGKFFITKYGTIRNSKEKDTYEVWFYNGIALRGGSKYYETIRALEKRLGLTNEEFCKKFQNLIRYYSIDRTYFLEGVLHKSTGIVTSEVYSGLFQMLGRTYYSNYINGKKETVVTVKGAYETPFRKIKSWDSIEKLNKVYKQCLLLMS